MIYRYIGKTPVSLPTLGVTVEEGQSLNSPVEINNPDFVLQSAAQAPVEQTQTEEIGQPTEEVAN